MNKRMMVNDRFSSLQSGTDYFGLIICGALFICGCIAGTASAGLASGTGLSEYIADYLPYVGEVPPGVLGFLTSLLETAKFHLAAVFLGFSVLGPLCLPALSAVRGFFLSFSISAIVRHFGGDGVFLALAVSGFGALLTVPCFFILSVSSFTASLRLLQGVTARGQKSMFPPFGAAFFKRIVICFTVLAFAALMDTFIMPGIIARITARIL